MKEQRPLPSLHRIISDEWMSGSLDSPRARIKDDDKCCGMIGWAQCETRQAAFSPITQQWPGGGTVLFVEQE